MSELSELSLTRVQYSLPDFPGADLRAKLESGRAAAEAALRKQLPDFKFDPDEALRVMHTIDAWAERNTEALAAAMKQPQNDLPTSLHTTLGSNKQVADFLVASFTLAAAGLGPWMGYGVHEAVLAGEQSEFWARIDAQTRLQSFGMIVKLDNDGHLGPIMHGESGTAGLGIAPVVWVGIMAVVTVFFAAVILTYLYNNRRLELNNELLAKMCLKAQADKNEAQVAQCIQALKELQQTTLTEQIGSTAMKVVIAGVGVYVIGRFVLPALLSRKEQKS